MRKRRMTLRAGAAIAAALLLALAAGSALAGAEPVPVWGSPVAGADSHTPTAVTCVSVTACLGVDGSGQAFSSGTPATGGWLAADAGVSATQLNGVSCVAGGACIAVGNAGKETVLSAIGGTWTAHAGSIDGSNALDDVACPTATLCIAVDNTSKALTSLDGGMTWSAAASLGSTGALNAISCPTATFCAAVDISGNVLTSSTPATFPWTSKTNLTSAPLTSISCASSSLCVATANDANGTVFATGNASAAAPTWSSTPLDPTNAPLKVSCSTTGLCAIVDAKGQALTSDNPAGGPPTWTAAPIDGAIALKAVSCIAAGLCLAVDQNGAAIAGLLPAPSVSTGTATSSSQTDATLTATVDPGDAALSSCQFNYGTATAYGTSVPCSAVPAPGGGAQAVSAQISGLSASTTYHFQITAASDVASAAGADGTFTTPPPLKASPSLSGTPAFGSTLTCKPNVTTTATETVAFVWTRDTVAIAGATAATYLVGAADETHHLACSVTIAGDGGSATATSGFDAIPNQNGSKILESFVGTASDSANTAKAPVTCSPQAAGKCTFVLTLTTKQNGTQTVIGRSSSSVAISAKATLSVHLNAAGSALLAKKRKLAVTLTVTGTVLGTLTATLQTDHFTFKATGRRHATRHRR
jgi:hypothetical protein